MNKDNKVYAVFYGEDLIGINKNGFGDHKFWYCDSKDPSSFEGTNIMLSSKQVADLLEEFPKLNGKNVYEFNADYTGELEAVMDMFKTDTSKAASIIPNIGDYSNEELIKKLRTEAYVMEEQEKQRLIDEMFTIGDAVKRPSHYMLEDGTEVKNHIRSILGDDGFKSWAIGNSIKYVSRYEDKGKPIQDLKKAQENIQMVIDVLGEQDDLD